MVGSGNNNPMLEIAFAWCSKETINISFADAVILWIIFTLNCVVFAIVSNRNKVNTSIIRREVGVVLFNPIFKSKNFFIVNAVKRFIL